MQNWSIDGCIQFLFTYDFRDSVVPDNEFQIRRAKLEFVYSPTRDIAGIFEIDCGQGEVAVKDAGIECRLKDCLIVFLGQHKMPFSREELRPASRLLVIDRGDVNDAFNDYGYLGRDIGLIVNGDINIQRYPVHYAFGVFNGSGDRAGGDLDDDKQFTERIEFGPVGDLSIGLNSTQRSEPVTHDARIAYGGDLSFRKGGLTIEAEALYGQTGTVTNMAGGYCAGSYRIGRLEPAVKLERFFADLEETDDHRSSVTGNLGWYFNDGLRLQADLISVFTPGLGPEHGVAAQIQLVF